MKKALFLDRDGVINVDNSYVHKPEDFIFTDNIFRLCKSAKAKDYLIIVITNQAGIARGYFTEKDFHKLNEWMLEKFCANGVCLDRVYFSPYHPTFGIPGYKIDSFCRKPNPGMIINAIKDFSIDISASILVGDKVSDIKAGLSAGIKKNFFIKPKQGNSYPTSLHLSDTLVIEDIIEIEPYL